MPAGEAFVSLFDHILSSSTQNISCDVVKDLEFHNFDQLEFIQGVIRVSKEMCAAYPYTIRETTPKEVRTRSTYSVLYSIGYDTGYKYREQKT